VLFATTFSEIASFHYIPPWSDVSSAHRLIHSRQAPEEAELADALEKIGNPDATIQLVPTDAKRQRNGSLEKEVHAD